MKTIIVKERNSSGFKIEGIASTQNRDLEGEVILQHGLDLSLVNEKSVSINLNHKGRSIGLITKAKVKGQKLWVEGIITNCDPKSNEIYKHLKTDGPLSLSIEMDNIEYSLQDRTKIISARLVGIAIINLEEAPANPNTYVWLIKSINRQILITELVRRSNDPEFKRKLKDVLSRYAS